MVSGTTSIAGVALSGGIKKLMKGVIGPFYFTWSVIHIDLFLCSRDDKRYTEKKNKTERARRKKEDIAKLRGLVDLALRYVLHSIPI